MRARIQGGNSVAFCYSSVVRSLILFAMCSLPLVGCASPDCSNPTTTFSVTPATATADHLAKAPGNQAQFRPQSTNTYPAGCAVPVLYPPAILDAIWTSSDPINVQISSVVGPTNGLATCVGATHGAVTITGKSSSAANALVSTASLTCQ